MSADLHRYDFASGDYFAFWNRRNAAVAEIGPAVDGEGRIFQRDQPGCRMAQMLGALAIGAHVIVAPHRCEFGAQPAEVLDQSLDVPRRPARAASARNAATTKRATLSQSGCSART